MNNLTRRLLAFVILLSAGPALGELGPMPLSVVMSIERRAGNDVVVFSVTNTSSRPVTIDESAFPWATRYSVTIVVVPERQDPLPGMFPVEDVFSDKQITLRPGDSERGEVQLAWHVKNPGATLLERDAVVFWHYKPKSSTGASLGEYGGWVPLKARSTSP